MSTPTLCELIDDTWDQVTQSSPCDAAFIVTSNVCRRTETTRDQRLALQQW